MGYVLPYLILTWLKSRSLEIDLENLALCLDHPEMHARYPFDSSLYL